MVAATRGARPAAAASAGGGDNQKTEAPSEAEMSALFEAAMRQQQQRKETSDGAPKVTPAEQQQFLSAMRDPEFRSLLNDYMQEISDPQNRAETEKYLAQLEKEQKVPGDKQLVKPKPGFVVKTRWDNGQKVFINVCSSDKLQPPSSTRVSGGKDGTSWNLPYSLGPERLEADKGGVSIPTFDACFHPRTLEFAASRADYRHMVASTCLDAVEPLLRESRRKPKAQLSRDYHVLKGVLYKSGDPVTMCLRKEREGSEPVQVKPKAIEKATPQAKASNPPAASKPKEKITVLNEKAGVSVPRESDRLHPEDKSVLNQLTHVEQVDDASSLLQEVSSSQLPPKPSDKTTKKMEYQLIYRGRFELLHHMQADPEKLVPEDRYRPKELVVEVSFPLSSSAKGLDLDVSERALRLSAGPEVPGDYEPLDLALPFPVIEDEGSAKFDRKNHKLVVTLPVQPPPKPKRQSVSLIVQDEEEEEEIQTQQPETPSQEASALPRPKPKKEGEDEFRMLRETALMVANDPQLQARAQREAESSASASATASSLSMTATEPCISKEEMYDDLPPLESCSEDEEEDDDAQTEAETSLSESTAELSAAMEPPYETQDTPTCLSYLVNVADIASSSVELSFPSPSSMLLRFSDKEQRAYELQIASLPVEIDPKTAEFDVASENMVVVLQKKTEVAKPSPQPELETAAPPLTAARFQNQLLYELD
ncbi:hypothetical protein BBJ28_00021695 [Nothophytophthora sp. Chile5]|nr:hypothetical protein BBJ28_00021695 [Nothophytophthora sp. Chile5]